MPPPIPELRPPVPTLSIVVPTLDEGTRLADTLARARAHGVAEIIVVDGGSTDATCAVARAHADIVLAAPRGRAFQMNAGAGRASGDVLLFLHADTLLPPGFVGAVRTALAADDVVGGRFDVDLEPSSPLLRLTSALINLRSRLSRIATGDQAIFVRREVFVRLGGYASIPLMEDLDLSRRMKRAGGIACLRERVTTSSRRWRHDGVVRTILLMWTLRFLYFAGVPAERLRRFYANTR
ncbi:TIGR04283 family arsenosugar biosynthesis glycosyltransferase [Candidatus Binatia bacterium]|nr:TIGR04283 family arsenosugar biosynthesis glycosyltransferase [Candidatus Binatia bacterium]